METKSENKIRDQNSKLTRDVSAAVDESLDKYRDLNKRVLFEYNWGEEDDNEEDTAASNPFGRKYKR